MVVEQITKPPRRNRASLIRINIVINQKSLAQFLDAAAARADLIDQDPATGKQCWFLAGLIVKAQDQASVSEAIDSNFILTKRRASSYIDNLLAA